MKDAMEREPEKIDKKRQMGNSRWQLNFTPVNVKGAAINKTEDHCGVC